MDEIVLLKECLLDKQVEEGRDLLGKLDAAKFPVKAAYWVFLWERNWWNLHIVTPEESRDHYKAFLAVDKAAKNLSDKVRLNFSVRGLKDCFYRHMMEDVRRDGPLSNSERERIQVGNELVDLYIYHLPAPQKQGAKHG
jgi:hypothetical protein